MLNQFFGDVSSSETRESMKGMGLSANLLDPASVARSIVWLLSEASVPVYGLNLAISET